jgi:3-hydroxyacyl-CoA dehydrogenase
LVETLGYAAGLVGEVADDILAIDRAMKLGFNWQAGPFEMMDQIGANWLVNQLEGHDDMAPSDILKTAAEKDGFYTVMDGKRHYLTTDGEYRAVERPAGITVLRDIKLGADPLINTGSAKVWDIGDGVVCLEFTSKMNAIDTQIFEAIDQTIDLINGSDDYLGLVIHNEADNFSVGANIGLALFALNVGLYAQVEQLIEQGQDTYQRLQQADFPVIGAPSGMALGGGCEVLLHCDKVIAHAETYMGLVEVGVGIVPGWGGCARLLERMYQCQNTDNDTVKNGPMAPVMAAFETISLAHVAKSAHLAREKYFIHPERDIIVMNRDRLLAQAKAEVLAMAPDYTPPVEETELPLPGPSGYVALKMAIDDYHRSGKATDHDVTVGNALARVLSGGDTDMIHPKHPDHIRKLEREVFMKLVREDKTLARMEHMLETGKPLRN